MKQPDWVTDDASWRKHCRRVTGRTSDLIEGKVSIVTGAREIGKLAFWLRASEDVDFMTFAQINEEAKDLPIDKDRQRWPGQEKEEEDRKIAAVDEKWREKAVAAATSLSSKYQ
ncbi:hypothetical protein A9Q99_00095 [Gammaproteobacteria bacterium 45_16_T64]|nr:hypothetical protein A9Q99_00095 [Gammaproteobacteria bacterium 45_16_T64]